MSICRLTPMLLCAGVAALALSVADAQPSPGTAKACAAGDTGRTARGIFYECAGGGGEAIVLIHAFSMDRRMWDGQLVALRQLGRVITYDLRGHGRSAPQTEPFTGMEDLLDLMDQLAIERAHLVGLSNGARIALDFALLHPERVRSLALAAPGASGYVGSEPMTWMAPVIESARGGRLEEAAARWAETPLMRISHDTLAQAHMLEIALANRALWGQRANLEVPLHPPAITRLHEVRAPVLIVSGENDLPDLRRAADTLRTGIPGAQFRSIEDAGHMVNFAAPAEFNVLLRAFLSALPRQQRGLTR